jgi:peptide/nickel transport system permease protein
VSTALDATAEEPSRLRGRAGLFLPGLGHLLCGNGLHGVGLLTLDAVLLAAAALGFPRLPTVLWAGPGGALAWHAAVAVVSWFALVAMLWTAAWRFSLPKTLPLLNSNTALFLRSFGRNRTGLVGFYGAATLVTLTLLTPLLAPFDPDAIDVGPILGSPGWHAVDGLPRLFVLGTDQYGRDLFSRTLYGGRISLVIGFIAVAFSATIGTTLGAVAGYVGGWVDRAIMGFVDLLLSLPSLVLVLAIVGILRVSGVGGIFLIVVILGLTGWMGVSRIVRSQVLSLKEQEFILAARALGLSRPRIIFRHLIPNALAPVIVHCSLAVGNIILAEAGLSFLGLGVPPPTSTWGTLVNDGREPLHVAPWIATFPGLCIVAAVMSFNLLGDGLRDTLDPRVRGK